MWANCLKYNGNISEVGKAGKRVSDRFELQWAGSGLDSSNSRKRRMTAGVAPHKYEEDDRRLRTGPSFKSGLNGSRKSRQVGFTRSVLCFGVINLSHNQTQRGLFGRRQSGEVQRYAPMDRERMSIIAQELGSLDGELLEGTLPLYTTQKILSPVEDGHVLLCPADARFEAFVTHSQMHWQSSSARQRWTQPMGSWSLTLTPWMPRRCGNLTSSLSAVACATRQRLTGKAESCSPTQTACPTLAQIEARVHQDPGG